MCESNRGWVTPEDTYVMVLQQHVDRWHTTNRSRTGLGNAEIIGTEPLREGFAITLRYPKGDGGEAQKWLPAIREALHERRFNIIAIDAIEIQ